MHTVELLDEAIEAATRLGIRVRQDWLAGVASGVCELQGQRWLILDLDAPPEERLADVLTCLAEHHATTPEIIASRLDEQSRRAA